MDSKITQQIEREIEQARQQYGQEWGAHYFNNFDGNLPGGYRRRYDPTSRSYSSDTEASEKRRNQSLAEFWATIDNAVEEVGINQRQIIEARNRFNNDRDLGNNDRDGGMFDLVIPVYIKLRELGYKHYPDLTA